MIEPILHRRMIWNGEWFQIAERRMELPSMDNLTYDIYQGWIGHAMDHEEFNSIQPIFEYLLENPPEEQGAAFADFIRFQMAMVDALISRVGQARDQLQKIVDLPSDPSKPVIAMAAAAFLKEYQGDSDIYRSCQAALSTMN